MMDPSKLRFVDISMPLENGVRSDPDIARPHIEYLGHDETVPRIQTSSPASRRRNCLTPPDGRWKGCSSPRTTARIWMRPTISTQR